MEEQSQSNNSTLFQRWFGKTKLYEFEVILFGFALVLGNRNFAWNQALVYGYDVLVTNTLFVGSAFFCLCLCMGEMTSALPFSGGIFGFVRAATGPYYGFIVACVEILFCLAYQIIITHLCVSVPVYTGAVEDSYIPNLIFIVYGFNLFINLLGNKPFWIIVNLAGFLTFFLLLCLLFGTLVDVNKSNISFTTFCQTKKAVTFEAIMAERLVAISQFQGLQYLPLLSEYTAEPRKTIPRAMVFCASEFITFSVFITLAACSTFPGEAILQMVPTPLMFGFQNIFNTNTYNSMWLHFPGIYAPTLTFLFCSGRQLFMIAKSGFLPSFFTYTTPQTNTPIVTLAIGTIIGSVMNLTFYYYSEYLIVLQYVLILASHIVFINAFIAYLFFRKKYMSLPRSFTSPLGVWGAYYGIVNNLFGFVSIFKYSSRTNALDAFYLLLVFIVSSTIFYWVYLVKRQTFSAEEKQLMFKAYLINANREKRGRMLKNNRVSNAPSVTTKSAASDNRSTNTKKNGNENDNESLGDSSRKDGKIDDPFAGLSLRNHYQSLQLHEENHDKNNSPNIHSKSLSERVAGYVNEKFNAISSEALEEYQQLAVISSGGLINLNEEQALVLEERFGMNDIEQSSIL